MYCPHCNHQNHNEIDLHSDGYAKDIIECSDCGTIWIDNAGQAVIINKPAQQSAVVA